MIIGSITILIIAGLVLVYVTRLLALESLSILQTLTHNKKHAAHYEYVNNLCNHLYKLYPVYWFAIGLNCLWMVLPPPPEWVTIISVLTAGINATVLVSIYNNKDEAKKFKDILKETGLLRDTDEDE